MEGEEPEQYSVAANILDPGALARRDAIQLPFGGTTADGIFGVGFQSFHSPAVVAQPHGR